MIRMRSNVTPIAQPLTGESELERTIRTEKNYFYTEEERQAIIAKYPILRPYKQSRTGYDTGGRGA